jgi:hypothetical protein
MFGKKYFFMLVVALLGGIAGGLLSDRLFRGEIVLAKEKTKKKILVANEFRVVDQAGRVLASFGIDQEEAALTFGSAESSARTSLSGEGLAYDTSHWQLVYGPQGYTVYQKKTDQEEAEVKPILEVGITPLIELPKMQDQEKRKLLESYLKEYSAYPYLVLRDRQGVKRVEISLDESSHHPFYRLYDSSEKNRLETALQGPKGEPRLALNDGGSTARAVLGWMQLEDSLKKATVTREASSLLLFDANGGLTSGRRRKMI